ncbi:hypothetical protein [Alteromonas gracilis]|uniref:hypothetical protein n=1 Tax=Alteromonas gracilis TaxID=1479524 RepID=UPI00373576B3
MHKDSRSKVPLWFNCTFGAFGFSFLMLFLYVSWLINTGSPVSDKIIESHLALDKKNNELKASDFQSMSSDGY